MAVDPALAREIRDFLSQDSTVDAMVDASDHGRPAVEAIGTELLRRFGDRVRPHKARQEIGRLVLPIMESRGLKPTHSRRIDSPLFTSGKVYCRDADETVGFIPQNPLASAIMSVLHKHDVTLSAPVASREVEAAISTVIVNRRDALPFVKGPWKILAITIDLALAQTADRKHAAVANSQLKPGQLEQLRVGLPPAETPVSPINAHVRMAFKYGALCATGITKERAARRLRCDGARVEALLSRRELYSVPIRKGVKPRLPLFQFDDDVTNFVPHVTKVFPELDRDLHPVGVFNWFTSPNPDLASASTEFEPISPRDWLMREYPPEPVCRLAAAVSAGPSA